MTPGRERPVVTMQENSFETTCKLRHEGHALPEATRHHLIEMPGP